ncbi:hypothetical protein ACFHW2_01065 [Actinomadura sp. LOL_016]|uniref:hypothetical protein n=1 Tax=unclassified Actinomadura TaxID=2626254 RepID=UPI003A7FF679
MGEPRDKGRGQTRLRVIEAAIDGRDPALLTALRDSMVAAVTCEDRPYARDGFRQGRPDVPAGAA